MELGSAWEQRKRSSERHGGGIRCHKRGSRGKGIFGGQQFVNCAPW